MVIVEAPTVLTICTALKPFFKFPQNFDGPFGAGSSKYILTLRGPDVRARRQNDLYRPLYPTPKPYHPPSKIHKDLSIVWVATKANLQFLNWGLFLYVPQR